MTTKHPSLLCSGSYIGGHWHQSNTTFTVFDKGNNDVIADVADAGSVQMTQAIDSAACAFPLWSALTARQRSEYLKHWHRLICEHRDELAHLLTREQGKPLAEARGEIDYGAGYISWFAEEALRINGDILAGATPEQQIQVVKKPVGVVGAVTPWNFPNAMIARKAAAALAAGCTFVVRPAAQTPLSALALAQLASRAGIPAGVFNVVAGTDAKGLGAILTHSSKIAKFSFTGSTEVGRLLIRDCASTIKRVSMELGGNAPFIVFEDADIHTAAEGAMLAKFRNAGQTCVCANRFLVHQSISAPFTDALCTRMASIRSGYGLNDVHMGPLISAQAAEQVHSLVQGAIAKGAKCLVGGSWSGGAFYPPTLLTDVTQEMEIFHQEIFGPVICIVKFDSDAQAVALANQTEYGLASYLYSQKLSRINRIASALDFGMVGINESAISNPMAPFGGVKHSGYGREGSKYGLDDYLSIQYRCLGGV